MIAGHYILACIFRTKNSDIRFSVTERAGRWRFHILVWEQPSYGGAMVPTGTDLDLPLFRMPEFFAAHQRAREKMSELGLLSLSPPRNLSPRASEPEGTE